MEVSNLLRYTKKTEDTLATRVGLPSFVRGGSEYRNMAGGSSKQTIRDKAKKKRKDKADLDLVLNKSDSGGPASYQITQRN